MEPKKQQELNINRQPDLFETEWVGMPEFVMNPEVPLKTIKISFKTQADIERFAQLLGQNIHPNIENYWFPKLNRNAFSEQVYEDET
jgi:hypothetical protein